MFQWFVMSKIRLFFVTFRMHFSSNSMIVQEPFPETVFWGSKCRPIIKNVFLGTILGPRQEPESTIGATFSTKKALKVGVPRSSFFIPEPTWPRFGAESCPKTIWYRFQFVLGRFGMYFGCVFPWFYVIFVEVSTVSVTVSISYCTS